MLDMNERYRMIIPMDSPNNKLTRRTFLQRIGTLGLLVALEQLVPACAWRVGAKKSPPPFRSQASLSGEIIDLTISETPFTVKGRTATAMTINGTIPGPVIRLKEGQNVTLRVTNHLKEITSIHWDTGYMP